MLMGVPECVGNLGRVMIAFQVADPKLESIRSYDLVHAKEMASGKDIARPAEFLLDSSGTIRWRMVTENFFKLAQPEQVLEAAQALQ